MKRVPIEYVYKYTLYTVHWTGAMRGKGGGGLGVNVVTQDTVMIVFILPSYAGTGVPGTNLGLDHV